MTRTFGVMLLTFFTFLVGVAPAMASQDPPPDAASVEPRAAAVSINEGTYTFTGGGWGHGVGMSQYGAYAMAADGSTASEILKYYYTGVAIATEADAPIWVNLVEDTTTVTFEVPAGAAGGVDLCQAGDGTGACPKSDAKPGAGETWQIVQTGSTCQFVRTVPGPLAAPAAPGDCAASITFGGAGQAAVIEVNDKAIGHGIVKIRQGPSQDDDFHAVLELSMEEYLRGLGEMPSSWPAEALEAQAIAGRTYAAFQRDYFWAAAVNTTTDDGPMTTSRKNDCYCHIRSTTQDQAYAGWSKESEVIGGVDYGAKWVAAVTGTAGDVVTAAGDLIKAYYMSSTGGVTENSEDVWGGYRSYVRSVPDPWSLTSANPYALWTKEYTDTELAAELEWDAISSVVLLNASPAATIRVSGVKDGVTTTSDMLIGPLYYTMGLRSPTVTKVSFLGDGPIDPSFEDILNSVHRYDINEIAYRGVTKGCNPPSNTKYCPSLDVTRGQMAAFIGRAIGLPNTDQDFFSDDDGTLFEDDINQILAVAPELACSATSFCAGADITRQEMAQFLVHGLRLTSTGSRTFTDIGSSPYQDEIEIIGDLGITLGCNPPTNDKFCPTLDVTRAQMASFLWRTMKVQGLE